MASRAACGRCAFWRATAGTLWGARIGGQARVMHVAGAPAAACRCWYLPGLRAPPRLAVAQCAIGRYLPKSLTTRGARPAAVSAVGERQAERGGGD